MLRNSLFIFVLSFLFLTGCSTKQESSPTLKQTTVQEPITVEQKTLHPSLHVVAPQGATIRILNIKPKYYDGIELEEGNYLIEVTKHGYQRFKKWVKVDKPTTYTVALKKQVTLSTFSWKFDNQKFYTLYDQKTQLIWALPTPYVDYVQKYNPKEYLSKTIAATSSKWPKIFRTKLDTIIYSGHFREKGKTYLFEKNNSMVLYRKSKRDSQKQSFDALTRLALNGIQNSWRIPTLQEFHTSNPFKKYQKYYQLIWNKGNIVKMNVPLIYTYKGDGNYYTNGALAYKRHKKLYNGNESSYVKKIKNSQGISLITPVRKKNSKTDMIVYNKQLSLDEKFIQLNKIFNSAQKTIKVLLGDPKLKNISYNKRTHQLEAQLYSTTNNFHQKISIKTKAKNSHKLKAKLLDERLIPLVKLDLKNGHLRYKALILQRNRLQEKEAYREAKRSQNINFYREYIKRYPKAPEAKKLQNLIKQEYKKKYNSL